MEGFSMLSNPNPRKRIISEGITRIDGKEKKASWKGKLLDRKIGTFTKFKKVYKLCFCSSKSASKRGWKRGRKLKNLESALYGKKALFTSMNKKIHSVWMEKIALAKMISKVEDVNNQQNRKHSDLKPSLFIGSNKKKSFNFAFFHGESKRVKKNLFLFLSLSPLRFFQPLLSEIAPTFSFPSPFKDCV